MFTENKKEIIKPDFNLVIYESMMVLVLKQHDENLEYDLLNEQENVNIEYMSNTLVLETTDSVYVFQNEDFYSLIEVERRNRFPLGIMLGDYDKRLIVIECNVEIIEEEF